METGRNVMHYALGDNQDYEHEWSKAGKRIFFGG